MQLVNEFSVDAPLDIAWAALTDVPRVVECIPGATLESHDGDDYRANVAIKVGPVGLTLAGTATVIRRDDSTHEMVVRGQASDRKGNGSAQATVTMSACERGTHTEVTVRTDLELDGRIAQFGSGVISQVSNRIIGQFVRRLNTMIVGADGIQSAAVEVIPAPRQPEFTETDWWSVLLTTAAGIALGLAIGRTAARRV
ncbi:SRPBCC family protein [Mycolicibacterium porcinum]|uniref:SRPBCC family protein n=1 Tax=Mycolicibacterium porcinum TaxID=39693 RepID=A0AAW5T478_9MYCO|nr:SRPBCC family protein [Mycolicibacterium porcinum]MCV7389896.1 SRPBCC family protein [Mycolicibacterium porcinum]ORB38269.1 carbon monoxide dehydrogenase [Mycolicibacterium porcinum]CDO30565.1 carbon monoxide dehydrogenase subunit G (CoxG) superfamily protein [Mycolicibacterium vulneris]